MLNSAPAYRSRYPFLQQPESAGKALADEFGIPFFETSAKDGTNVKEAFHALAREAVANLRATQSDEAGASGAAGVRKIATGKKKDCVVQ